jgi:response regulator RpfG family c-di-GMP phosphodiesterase
MTLKYKHTVFLIDDEESIVRSLQRLFRKEGYEILTATNGPEGLDLLKKVEKPVSLFISDQRMPEMTGAEFLEKARSIFPEAMRFLLTGYSSMDAVVDAINKGAIHRYINKPWDDNDLLSQVHQALEQYELILENKRLQALTQKQNQELKDLNKNLEGIIDERTKEVQRKNEVLLQLNKDLVSSLHNSVRSFASLTEMFAPSLAVHGRRVSHLAREIALHMALSEKEIINIEIAALLHDMGKLGMPPKLMNGNHEILSHKDETLYRRHPKLAESSQGKWTAEEEALYKRHPEEGQNIVRLIKNLDHVGLLIRSHHERFDGNGYPDRLSDEMIPFGSKIIAVADAWDKALNFKDESQYVIDEYLKGNPAGRNDMSHEELLHLAAVDMLKKNAFVRFDPDIIKVFLNLIKTKDAKEQHSNWLVSIDELEVDMVLAMTLYTGNGRFLLPQKTVLNKDHIAKLKIIHKTDPITEKIQVEKEKKHN